MTSSPPVDAVMARLLALHPRRIDLGLGRMRRILAALGHPERDLPPVIQVAGTNGKGSTVAFMRAMLEAAGRRVHVYTSPHLVRINERFRLAGPEGSAFVSDEDLIEVLDACERANGEAPITVFEIETAAAFLLFSKRPADVSLLEVGLGGRLDATNVIERPIASVITSVSIDHVEFLGGSVEKIAFEKAGILKRGVPGVIARQSDVVRDVLVERGTTIGAKLHVAGEDWMAGEERGRLVYQDADGLLDLPAPRLFGRHQFDNAGAAIAALRVAGLDLPTAAFEEGIVKAEWPGRMQRLPAGPLTALLPDGAELWLDGGHNVDGGRLVAAALGDLEERVSRPLVLVVGMLANKDLAGFLRNFLGLALRLIAVPIPHDKGFAPDEIASVARELGLAADAAADLDDALVSVRSLALDPPPRVLVTGSLYLAGEVLSANGIAPR